MTTWLEPVKLASTKTDGNIPVNVPWSGMIDGRSVALGDRVLLAHEHVRSKNGIYLYMDKGDGPQLVGPEDVAADGAVLVLDGEAMAFTEHMQHEAGVWNSRKVFVMRAMGEGEADATAAIQEALTAALKSGMSRPTIFLPPIPAGYLIEGQVEVLRPCTILGHGTTIRCKLATEDAHALSSFRLVASDVTFVRLRFEQAPPARVLARLVNNGDHDGVYEVVGEVVGR